MKASQVIFKSDAMMERVTEQRKQYNADRLAEYEQRGVQYVEFTSQPDCCVYCTRLYRGKKFDLNDFKKGLAVTGGTNQGVLKSNWSPYVLIAHPWCRCRPWPVYD